MDRTPLRWKILLLYHSKGSVSCIKTLIKMKSLNHYNSYNPLELVNCITISILRGLEA